MQTPNDHTVLVAGGTGNVGGFIVSALLDKGAHVIVPSRSEEKLHDLELFIRERNHNEDAARLTSLVGDLSDTKDSTRLRQQIHDQIGLPTAAIASLGEWRSAPSLLTTDPNDLQTVLDGYLMAHYKVAQALLHDLTQTNGKYLLINGPLAFNIWPGSNSTLISIATAAQHMLFKALAEELKDTTVQINELVTHAFIRNRTTQPGSPLPGEHVGKYATHLLTGNHHLHGQSIALTSPQQVEELTGGTSLHI